MEVNTAKCQKGLGEKAPTSEDLPKLKQAFDLLDTLVEIGRKEDVIIKRIAEAVNVGDRDKVFELAQELVGHDRAADNSSRTT
jgi:hypothetical protein